MKTEAFVALVFGVLLAATAGAQVFKWTDENGKVHYGEKPPPGVKATEIGVPSAPAGSPPATPSWKDKELDSKRQQIERERKQQQEESRSGRREQARAHECAEARKQLSRLEEQIPIYTRNSKGERVYMEDKDRPAAIAEERRLIAANCN